MGVIARLNGRVSPMPECSRSINGALLIAQMAVGVPLIELWGVEGAALTILLTESTALVWLGSG